MINIAGIFKHRVLNLAHLLSFGFMQVDNNYTISYEILNGIFQMDVIITITGEVSVRVCDTDNQEEYVLVHTLSSCGTFVSSVIQACEEKLAWIAEECFDYVVFKEKQTMQIIEYVDKMYQDRLEFLWKKSPGNAVLRRKDDRKWYAVILCIAKEKLGLEGTEIIEIMNLRALPNDVEQVIDGKQYFLGYHMNKKHWYTICLNGSISTQEICERIDRSYALIYK